MAVSVTSSSLLSELDSPELPVFQEYPSVISRLRSRKRTATNPPPVTPTRRTNRSRRYRISSSPPAPVPLSSPYRIRIPVASLPNASFISLPYEFDEQFYTNSVILNDNLDVDSAIFGTANNTYIKYMRQAYKNIIDSTKLEEFELIEILNPPR